MAAVWMRARNELRTRWRALLSLALIAGLGGAAAIAALAGARRTVGVYPRFRAATNAFDDLIGVNGPITPSDSAQTQTLSSLRMPQIIDSSVTDAYNGTIVGPTGAVQAFPDVFVVGGPDGKLGTTIDTMKLESGRYADPTRADEVTVSSLEAQALSAHVGSTLTLKMPGATRQLHVVGIGLIAGSVDPSAAAYTPVVLVTPAFYAQNDGPGQRQGPTLVVRIRGGLAAVGKFESALAALGEAQIRAAKNAADRATAENDVISTTISAIPQNEAVRRTALFEAVGLAIFGGLALLTVLAIFAQLLARQIFLETDDQEALRALGMSRAQLFGLSIVRVAIVGACAALLSVGIAIAASSLFPIGFMHRLEVSPGVRVDVFALAAGAAGIFVLILLAGLLPAWRASSARQSDRNVSVGANRAANALAGAAFPPTAVAGVRMALEPGHGSNAVPVRTTIFGTILALAALLAALTFGAGLQHLVATPSLSGWNFDAILPGNNVYGPIDPIPEIKHTLEGSPVVQSMTRGSFLNLEINGTFINGFSFAAGPFGTSIASGRAPAAAGEIALNARTLRALHTSVGKSVPVIILDPSTNLPATKRVTMRIVGTAVTPQFFFTQFSGGFSGVVSEDTIDSSHIPGVERGGDTFYLRFRSGVPLDQGLEQVRNSIVATLVHVQGEIEAALKLAPPRSGRAAELGQELGSFQTTTFILKRASTSDLANLSRISSLPSSLAALLGLVAAGTLAHTLITSVRRRRRDLAVLRALGFVRRQVALAVAWQATTITIISLAIGLPLGAIAGRLAWRAFVNQLGYVPVTIVPLLGVIIAIPAVIVLGNLIASIPARAAARTEPAAVLRAE